MYICRVLYLKPDLSGRSPGSIPGHAGVPSTSVRSPRFDPLWTITTIGLLMKGIFWQLHPSKTSPPPLILSLAALAAPPDESIYADWARS